MWTRIVYGKRDSLYNYSEFICDTEDDIPTLPTNKHKSGNEELCSIGSKALVIDSGKLYILNNNSVWRLFKDCVQNGNFANLDIATISDLFEYLEL